MALTAIPPEAATLRAQGAPAGAGAAGRGRETDWEFLFQTGRVPQDPEGAQGFNRYLCRQLEATAINNLLQAARGAAPQKGLFSGGFAGSMYQGLADEEYSKMIAARGGFGLGDVMYNQMAARLEAEKAYRQARSAGAENGFGAQGSPKGSDN
jgi:hypothetical protein